MAKPTPDRDHLILEAIAAAARAGEPCPANSDLAALIGVLGTAGVVRALHRLEAAGALAKRGTSRSRQYYLPALDICTAMPDYTREARDALAELVAEGASLYAAGKTLGLSVNTIDRLWRRIRDELGPQAI